MIDDRQCFSRKQDALCRGHFGQGSISRTSAALASANEYHMARDPRGMEVRLGYARMPSGMAGNGIWTAGDPDGEE